MVQHLLCRGTSPYPLPAQTRQPPLCKCVSKPAELHGFLPVCLNFITPETIHTPAHTHMQSDAHGLALGYAVGCARSQKKNSEACLKKACQRMQAYTPALTECGQQAFPQIHVPWDTHKPAFVIHSMSPILCVHPRSPIHPLPPLLLSRPCARSSLHLLPHGSDKHSRHGSCTTHNLQSPDAGEPGCSC